MSLKFSYSVSNGEKSLAVWESDHSGDVPKFPVEANNDVNAVAMFASLGRTFLNFKYAGGTVLSDDQAMANAIATIGRVGGTLVIDAGVTIHLTRSVTLTYSMQVVSADIKGGHSSVIESSAADGVFVIGAQGRVLLQGLNIVDSSSSGSIVVMKGDSTTLRDDTFINATGNTSTMVRYAGYNQTIQDCAFTNNEHSAYCWDLLSSGTWAGFDGTSINDSLVGGSAEGVGKGGRLENIGTPTGFTDEGFTVVGWNCSTQSTQLEANDVYSLSIHDSVFNGSNGTAIVIGGGDSLRGALGVTIDRSYISAVGTAIDAATESGSGANYVTVENSTIANSDVGIAANSGTGRLNIVGNAFSGDNVAVHLDNPQGNTVLVANNVDGGAVDVHMSSPGDGIAAAANAFGAAVTFEGTDGAQLGALTGGEGAGQVVVAVSASLASMPSLENSTVPLSVGSARVAEGMTFLDFKVLGDGTVLSDDEAMAHAIAALGPTHGTLVIDEGTTVHLTHTVQVKDSMVIESSGIGLDPTVQIEMDGGHDLFNIEATGTVVVQGLNLESGTAGSIITTGTGNTIVRNCGLSNIAGNASTMVVLQGSNQLLENDNFTNNEASALCWDAAYSSPAVSIAPDVVSGGWAYGIGKGGVVGDVQAATSVDSFEIDDWTAVLTGAVQIDAENVGKLAVRGGIYDFSSENAFLLGNGTSRAQNISISDAYISTASSPTTGTAISVASQGGAGVSSLTVSGDTINFTGTAISADGQSGALTISGNNIFYVGEGLDIADPTGAVDVFGNHIDANVAVRASDANSAHQSYAGNSLSGKLLISGGQAPSSTFVGNVGSTIFADENGVPLQPGALSASTTPEQLSHLSIGLIGALTPAQFAALTIRQLAALTPQQLAILTPQQLATLTPLSLAALAASQLNVLSAPQVQAIGSADFGSLTTPQVTGLSQAFIASLTPSQLAAVPLALLASFSPAETAALSLTDVMTLSAQQTRALSIALPPPSTTSLTTTSPDPLFDAVYYLDQNPDVVAAGADPYQHFMTYGWHEGRNPDALFNTNYYLDRNPDVKAAGVNPLMHYEDFGWKEGRDPSNLFSDSRYLDAYPDAAHQGLNPLLSYEQAGGARIAFLPLPTIDPGIDAAYYQRQANLDLSSDQALANEQAGIDYSQRGWENGLDPDQFFNTSFYLSHNPDVAAAHIDPLLHYETYGWREGRDPSALFSTKSYLAANPDVKGAGVDPLIHYLEYGQTEGRAIFPG